MGFWLNWGAGLVASMIAVPALAAGQQPMDAESMEVFFDRVWEESLSHDGVVPGAVITVVHEGEVVFNKGYGTRDSQTTEPADPLNTRLRIGSVSKLFTAMTALALVDEGKLDLNRDVNDYLREVQVPDAFQEPVTVRSLLSHLSGFDAGISGFMVEDNNELAMDPREHQRRLRQLRPVGREYGYDNTGLGLIGHISGAVNGTRFADAVSQKVLQPLKMAKTSMGVPDWQLEDLAACHSWDSSGQLVECKHLYMRSAYQGAGDITTTGDDMARFMLALLDDSCLDGRCVLKPATHAQFVNMDTNRFHPLAKGMGYIMYEKARDGHHSIGHDGGQTGFSTSLTLFPETGTGIFISLFSYIGIPALDTVSMWLDFIQRGSLVDNYGAANGAVAEFAETFFPEPREHPMLEESSFDRDDLSILDGIYVDTRQIGSLLHTRMMRTLATMKVEATSDEVIIDGKGPYRQSGDRLLTMEGEPLEWFYQVKGDHVVMQNSDGLGIAMFAKQPWHQQAKFAVFPLLPVLLLALPALFFARRQRECPARRKLGYLVCFSGLALWVGLYFEFEHFAEVYYRQGPGLFLFGWRALINLSWVSALFALYVAFANCRELVAVNGFVVGLRSLFVALLVIAALGVAVLLPYWGLVGNFGH